MTTRHSPRQPCAPHQAQRLVHELLEQRGAQGLSPAELAHLRGVSTQSARDTLYRLVSNGVAVARCPAPRTLRFWLPQHAPPPPAADAPTPRGLFRPVARPVQRTYKTTSIAKARLTLDPAAPAIVPPGVKITRCPSGEDMRFRADPRIRGRGVISRDWQRRRRAAPTPKEA